MMDRPLPMPRASSKYSTVILADGAYPSGDIPLGILSGADKVICCDGAANEFVKRGGEPYAIVGDGDSVLPHIKEKYSDRLYMLSDQESNDLAKAVIFCVGNGFDDIAVLGATGKREDHFIGNLGWLIYFTDGIAVKQIEGQTITMPNSICMIDDSGIYDGIHCDTRFDSFPGMQVSIVPADRIVSITTVDLKYPLLRARLEWWWRGTLNEASGDSFGILCDGPAVVYRTFP